MTCPMPEVYKTKRPYHDDCAIAGIPAWLQPQTWIPRSWTHVCLPLPFKKLAGNQELAWHRVQENYGLYPPKGTVEYKNDNGLVYVLAPHPVPKPGQWSIQGYWSYRLKTWIPCYTTKSAPVLGKRLHLNGPIKPDMTYGDWACWLEGSLSWTKL